MSKLKALAAKLREIFQINKPEQDFGIYRNLPGPAFTGCKAGD